MSNPAIVPALFYRDPKAALMFLETAFGFELELLLEDEQGNLQHSQMSYGGGLIMVGTEWSEHHQSPASLNGRNTQTTHIYLRETTADTHCATARAAGAEILQEPTDQFYGDRTYRARDPEGHIWTFSQTLRHVPPSEWDRSMGFRTWSREDAAKG